MTQREREYPVTPQGQVRDIKDHPLDPPQAPALSIPRRQGHHALYDGVDDRTEAVKVFAVLGLLGLVLVLFIGLMLVLNALSVF